MIKPTVGRMVWFIPHVHGDTRFDVTQPLSANIAYVHSDRMINIGYLDQLGVKHSACSVHLLQDGDATPEDGFYCVWMPYQKEQAEKSAAEGALLGGVARAIPDSGLAAAAETKNEPFDLDKIEF